MTEPKDTNIKIAALLQQQTYAERMELAAWFRDALNDLKVDAPPKRKALKGETSRNYSKAGPKILWSPNNDR